MDNILEILDVIRERLFEVQVEEYLPVYVVPLRSLANATGVGEVLTATAATPSPAPAPGWR